MYYIYRITNKVNGKTYIGQHKYKDFNDNYMGSGKLIRRAQKKYGMENFEKEILYSRIQYKETVDSMERFAIAKERAIGKAEYNIADGGNGGNLGNGVNKKHSETCKGTNNPHFGKKHKEESKRKISDAMKRHYVSDETRRKMSESHKGKAPWNKGKKGTSTSCKGKHWKLVDGKRVWY